jgi:uncharacterized membrane protein YdbT with pleckstrin-like domain
MSNQYRFKGQHEDEDIVRVIHRHWFNISSHLIIVFFASFFLVGSIFAMTTFFPDAVDANALSFFLFVENTFFIFIWLFSFLVWIDYYFDVWIVTTERIVNIEQKGLFVRRISELNFARVQDVSAEVNGFIPTIMDYGDVTVQTAGEEENFIFRQVSDPYAIKDLIMKLSRNNNEDIFRRFSESLVGRKA